MRSNLMFVLVLLVVVLAGSIALSLQAKDVSQTYVTASQELERLIAGEEWEQANKSLAQYRQAWEDTLDWLQMQVDHEAADDVTQAMLCIGAGIDTRSLPMALLGCKQLEENARHIYHRDAFTLGNVL